MKLIGELRNANWLIITENPVDIEITRTRYSGDGGGGRSKTVVNLPPITCRLVPSKGSSKVQDEAQLAHASELLLIAAWDAEIKADPNNVDKFELGGYIYEIISVTRRCFRGEVYSVQALVRGLA